MRFLADENFPASAVLALRTAGRDVVSVGGVGPGMTDPDVLAWLARDRRVLLTFDKDFGELARTATLPSTCGVVPFRIGMPRPSEAGSRLANLIMARSDWVGHCSVVEPSRVRMRPLAPPPSHP